MIVFLGRDSEGDLYFLKCADLENNSGLCLIDSSTLPVWCKFGEIVCFNPENLGIYKNGDEWVVKDWCNTPKGLLYAGVAWFDSFVEAYKYTGANVFDLSRRKEKAK